MAFATAVAMGTREQAGRPLLDVIVEHLAERPRLVLLDNRDTSSTGCEQSNFYARHFKPAAVRAGVDPKVRFHDLRHSYAAILIAWGAHPRAMMERAGHSSIQVTMDTYGHLFPFSNR